MDPKKRPFLKYQTVEGRYSNYFKVGYNAFEFVIDFGQSYSENDQTELCARIVTGPVYAKTLLSILQSAIDCYEQNYGVIKSDNE
jgi:hypothetical protein